ncbi:MAG TPA: hypothetical protein VL172_02845, partial [Kofleriaceae bacterium]|nr:hypothetical protein [Kofleriaceae bacterium]
MRIAAALLLSLPLAACSASEDKVDPGLVGQLFERALDGLGTVPEDPDALEYQIYQLDDTTLDGDVDAATCDAVDQSLVGLCDDLYQHGEAAGCGYTTSFFYAHAVPRCAVRLELYPDPSYALVHPTYLLDFAGTPIVGPEPTCGNAVLDDGEDCDDGNHELWDGCDSNCQTEPFTGCETVIEHYFDQSQIAHVDATTWSEPRTHLMVHGDAAPLRPLDSSLC